MQNQQGQRGAIVMEASLALPFFMFAIYTLLSVIQISYTQARVAVALDSATKQVAQYIHVYFALDLDETFDGQSGESSAIANDVADFLQGMGEGLGTINDELGAYVDNAGNALRGDSLVAMIQDLAGSVLVEQMMKSNLVDGPGDTPDEFLRRNRIEDLNMDGSKFLEAGADSTGKDIFMRVNYKIRVIKLLNIDFCFSLSHCAYAQAWAGGE